MAVTVTPSGLPVAAWASTLAGAPALPAEALAPRGTRLVVVSAHPDDETLGAGRLLAQWARSVGPVHAVTLTAGEACLDAVEVSAPDLAARRVAEWLEALGRLGALPGARGICPDGEVAAHLEAATAAIGEAAGPGDVVLCPWRHDPHPDHAAAGAAAARAAEERGTALLEYPVWMPYWMGPEEVAALGATCTAVRTDAQAEVQREAALAAYVSQREPLAPGLGPVVPDLLLAHHHTQLLVA